MKEEIKEGFRTNKVINVVFTKKDGTERSMNCSLNGSIIPVENHPKTKSKTDKTDFCIAFDVDKQAWRSLHYSTVKTWSVVE